MHYLHIDDKYQTTNTMQIDLKNINNNIVIQRQVIRKTAFIYITTLLYI